MKRFSIVNEGYDIDEVNRFIDIVIGRMEKLNAENASLMAKIEKISKDTSHIDTERLDKVLLMVEETSDKMKELAKEEARVTVEEARNNANSIIHEALIKAEKIEQERILLEKNIKIYKDRIRSLAETELRLINDIDKDEL